MNTINLKYNLMKNQNSALIPEEEKLSFTQFIQKTQEETIRVQNLLDSIENESSKKNSLLQSRSKFFQKSADTTKVKVSDLDQEILNVQNRILSQKKQICQQKFDDQQALRKLKILEQDLQHSQQKYNSAVSKNRLIRDNIDILRKDQKIFKDLCKSLQNSIGESKQKMEEMTEIGAKTRKNREFAEVQINELESQADVETKEYKKSINTLKGLIRKEKSLKNEIGSVVAQSNLTPDSRVIENEEIDLKKKIVRLSWKIAQDKANMMMNLNKLEEYEDIIKKFQELTGVSNYQSLLKHYMETREHNKTLTEYVENLNAELQQLENQLVEVKSQVSNYRILTNDNPNKEVNKEVKNNEKNVEKKQKKHDLADFDKMKKRISEIFSKVGGRSIKDSSTLNEFEIVVAQVKEIERRCHEIVDISSEFKQQPEGKHRSSYKIEVEIPTFQDKEKDTDEDDGYLTWQEFGNKEQKKIKRKK